MSSPRSLSPWWALLLLIPVALGAGRLIGGAPVAPKPDAVDTAAHPLASPDQPAAHASIPAFPSGEASAPAAGSQPSGTPSPAAADPAQPATPSPAAAGGSLNWLSLGEAIEQSRVSGKPVLLDFNADWCGPCQRMKHEVFESSLAPAIAGAVLPVSVVDQSREMGANPSDLQALQEKFHVRAFPTLVVLCPATGKAATQEGYRGAEYTQEWITQAAAAVRQ